MREHLLHTGPPSEPGLNNKSFLEEAEKLTSFDLLTLKFDLEGQMPQWQPGLSETLDHDDTL